MFTQVGTTSPTSDAVDCRQTQLLFNQQNMMIPATALLLNNKLTMNYICNPDIVYNIHGINQCCTVATNTRTTSTCFKGSLRQDILPMEEETWFDPDRIANILALHIMQSHFKIDYTNWKGTQNDQNKFIVHWPNKNPLHFIMSETGLYYANLKFLTLLTASTFMQTKLSNLKFPPTVAEQLEKFSKRDQEDARNAQ